MKVGEFFHLKWLISIILSQGFRKWISLLQQWNMRLVIIPPLFRIAFISYQPWSKKCFLPYLLTISTNMCVCRKRMCKGTKNGAMEPKNINIQRYKENILWCFCLVFYGKYVIFDLILLNNGRYSISKKNVLSRFLKYKFYITFIFCSFNMHTFLRMRL